MAPIPTEDRRWRERIERKLDLLLLAAGIEIKLEVHMDAAGQALEAEVAKIDADEQTELAQIQAGGEAVVAAGTKFSELKAQIESLKNSGALSDTEAEALLTKANEVDEHIGTATTELTAHVAQLNEESAAA